MSRMLAPSILGIVLVLILFPTLGIADPCLMVYPAAGNVIYHYESAEYYVVGPGHPLYEAAYDRGGEVLIDINTGEIAYEVYQANGLSGFLLDEMHQGYFLMALDFDISVDGFNNFPTTYTNVVLVFDLIEPTGCMPSITIDGNPVLWSASLGWYWPIGDFVVSTPSGSNYSDIQNYAFSWAGCQTVRIWAFSDEDFNLHHDGGECFSAYSHDLTVPVKVNTWGKVKSLYNK